MTNRSNNNNKRKHSLTAKPKRPKTLVEGSVTDAAVGGESGCAFDHFSSLPPEIRVMVWEEVVGTPSCKDKLTHCGRTYGTISKTTEIDLRDLLVALSREIPKHHTFYSAGRPFLRTASAMDEAMVKEGYRMISGAYDLPEVCFDVPTLREAEDAAIDGYNERLLDVIWPHAELTLEFPVHGALRLFTSRRYFEVKGYFTRGDIFRKTLDFYWEFFTTQEVAAILAFAPLAYDMHIRQIAGELNGSESTRGGDPRTWLVTFERVFGRDGQDLLTQQSFTSAPQLRNSLIRGYHMFSIHCITEVAHPYCSIEIYL